MTDRVKVTLVAQRLEREGRHSGVGFASELLVASELLLSLLAENDALRSELRIGKDSASLYSQE